MHAMQLQPQGAELCGHMWGICQNRASGGEKRENSFEKGELLLALHGVGMGRLEGGEQRR